MLRSFSYAGIMCATVIVANPTQAATFNVFDAPGGTLLGQFDAPTTGGLLTSAAILYLGAIFDVLAAGDEAPLYHADTNDVSGSGGGGFGSIFNSTAFEAPGFGEDPVLCGVGECVFSMERAFDGAPGAWYVDKVSGDDSPAAIDLGNYEIAPVPLPAALGLLTAACGVFGAMARRRR